MAQEHEQCGDMRAVYRQNREDGMGYGDQVNFSYELQQAILRDKERLAGLKNSGASAAEIAGLEKCIAEKEDLLQAVDFDLHGIDGI
ncbi:hypothetical protein [Desulfotomaculum copahuensis]|uniref:Uncharacterized protein n=1 Tax=Desulfotomaculum copahuensis TaxID=1838280 RepID=A0A1B7LDS3_9FIRM|nr:hypothetical protein [Desulfotomaculum copahuensis]OAT81258.1 hypothetical protein A6M21_00210 [Desulfotomaculum copahuensis]